PPAGVRWNDGSGYFLPDGEAERTTIRRNRQQSSLTRLAGKSMPPWHKHQFAKGRKSEVPPLGISVRFAKGCVKSSTTFGGPRLLEHMGFLPPSHYVLAWR